MNPAPNKPRLSTPGDAIAAARVDELDRQRRVGRFYRELDTPAPDRAPAQRKGKKK